MSWIEKLLSDPQASALVAGALLLLVQWVAARLGIKLAPLPTPSPKPAEPVKPAEPAQPAPAKAPEALPLLLPLLAGHPILAMILRLLLSGQVAEAQAAAQVFVELSDDPSIAAIVPPSKK